MSSELQPGQVTVADLFRVMTETRTEVAAAMSRIEVINARNITADRLDLDHESRIRALETFRWKLAGLVLALAVILSPLGAVIAAMITRK